VGVVTRDRWLAEGVEVLRGEGASGLRVDKLARRLGLTKGSFHHHFAGTADYRRALLAHCCLAVDRDVAEARRRLGGLTRTELASALPAVADGLHDRALDLALRGWAVEDAEARAAVAAIDGARLAFLEELWTGALGDPAAARVAALVPHLVTVGASLSPGLRDDELDEVFRLLGRLVPARP
jgi:AcrR family transcriptional regulator